jgi:uncharacterized protein (DUF2236 family)
VTASAAPLPTGEPALTDRSSSGAPRFTRASLIRQVGGEPVMFLGAQRALLMQIAHPLVGAAVDDHSTFRQLPVRRLWATADAMLMMVWGEGGEPAEARQRIMTIHDRIHGTLPAAVGRHAAAARYDAHDAELVRWVWATLVETMVNVHVRWLGPLDHAARGALLADWRQFAEFFGLPAGRLPSTWADFKAWYRGEEQHLAVGPAGRAVAAAILDPPLWFVPAPVKRAYALVAAGLLSPELRTAYGIRWGEAEQAQMDTYDRSIRAFWAQAPPWRRDLPYAYLTARRVVAPRYEALTDVLRRTSSG